MNTVSWTVWLHSVMDTLSYTNVHELYDFLGHVLSTITVHLMTKHGTANDHELDGSNVSHTPWVMVSKTLLSRIYESHEIYDSFVWYILKSWTRCSKTWTQYSWFLWLWCHIYQRSWTLWLPFNMNTVHNNSQDSMISFGHEVSIYAHQYSWAL